MNERDDLERQLDDAFASTRPRRGFEDELWAQLQARRRRPALRRILLGPELVGVAAVLLVGVAVFGLVLARHGGVGSGAGGAAPVSQSAPAKAADGRFGALPRPPDAVGPAVGAAPGRTTAGASQVSPGAFLPPEPIQLPVYRYSAQTGPAPGTIVEPGSIPPGFVSTSYPARSSLEAIRDAGSAQLAITDVRLVYVAVGDGGSVYLEPVYLVTGTASADGTKQERQVLVSALASTAYR